MTITPSDIQKLTSNEIIVEMAGVPSARELQQSPLLEKFANDIRAAAREFSENIRKSMAKVQSLKNFQKRIYNQDLVHEKSS